VILEGLLSERFGERPPFTRSVPPWIAARLTGSSSLRFHRLAGVDAQHRSDRSRALRDELTRCQSSERAVWPALIVVDTPRFNLLLGIRDRRESMDVWAFAAEPPVEGLDKGIFHGFTRSNEIELHAVHKAQSLSDRSCRGSATPGGRMGIRDEERGPAFDPGSSNLIPLDSARAQSLGHGQYNVGLVRIVPVYFERRKVNSMDPSSQLRPPSLDESSL
jgi:hypothetical protein